ncbi:small ubiquitin-related modifier 3, partial [Pelobates cultripes]
IRSVQVTYRSGRERTEILKKTPDNGPWKVAGQDGSVVQFKIKRHASLNNLMKGYCERPGLPMRQI